jgi:glycosyltransferase involved in cell wall biosynthesis
MLASGPNAVAPTPAQEGVLFVGRLYPVKGVETLTIAMRTLWEAGETAPLVLAGSDGGWRGGPMADRLRELAKPFSSRVVALGGLPARTLLPLLASARVVALPSHWEAFPFSVVETLAVGRPLVTTSGHGADDIVRSGRDALTVEAGNAEQLAGAIDRLLTDQALADRLAAAAAARAEYFDVGPGGQRFARYYASLLG